MITGTRNRLSSLLTREIQTVGQESEDTEFQESTKLIKVMLVSEEIDVQLSV